ncbi:sdad1 protein [Moniliophthora roreri MCA 2997]|uniref:Sdad1 protein n=2 Tax=Moniliophthora roreri TaxID=221103 RepID=V2XC97_MONRO|nr:sdad1 protein [Moniliophthora roreri MCA 2997]KAI3613573.1 sdad1 protein [Moniliophthora roreri]
MESSSSANTLGLEFNNLSIKDANAKSPEPAPESSAADVHSPSSEQPDSASKDSKDGREKKKPYVNPDRFKTGGTQRDKLTEEELAERMERIRQQNEKIKQRRLDVQADEDAFRQTQEADRMKQARNRKVQDNVDQAREQNAKRKMDKIQSREWDSGKTGPEWKGKKPTPAPAEGAAESEGMQLRDSGQWTRGGRGGGRGRGGRGGGRGGARKPAAEGSPSQAVAIGTPTEEKSQPVEEKTTSTETGAKA